MEDTKKPWFSKSIILNAVGLILSAVVMFVPQVSSIQAWLAAPSHLAIIGSVWGVLGIIFRLVSKDKISLRD